MPGADSRRTDDSAPFDTFTVARTRDVVTAIGGLRVVPDYAWAHAPLIDILVVPGGFGTRSLLKDTPTIDWIREVAASASQVTSVCTGALLLAQAGLLNGRRATTHWAGLDLLASLDPTIKIERGQARRLGRCRDSAGVSAGIDMAFTIVERLCGRGGGGRDGALHRVSASGQRDLEAGGQTLAYVQEHQDAVQLRSAGH